METFLQSNEIKIPKTNQVPPSKIDFKSSYARSLSFSNNYFENAYETTKSLDFEINFQSCIEAEDANICDKSSIKSSCLNDDDRVVDEKFNESCNKSNKTKERQLWRTSTTSSSTIPTTMSSRKQQQISSDTTSNDVEILRLRQECQSLIEENRKLQSLNHSLKVNPFGSLQYDCNGTVEAVVLQTKVETLHWQLRQVESSRQMYRAIMEEVARYLEKCHLNFDLLQQRERDKVIERSKSIAYIAKPKAIPDLSYNGTEVRARSSTNLLSWTTQAPKQQKSGTLGEISYNAFKDFTWRRSPKNKLSSTSTLAAPIETKSMEITTPCDESIASFEQIQVQHPEINAEKLSKEAFRLLRTVQNFLNTHEPLLSQTNSSDNEGNSSQRSSLETQRTDFLFGFDRESHCSDGSSVHSSSQSSNSKDDDPTILPNITNKTKPSKNFKKRFSACHQTEDESGFSSMNSFHEIGLPLHSTLLSANTSTTSASSSEERHSETIKVNKPTADDQIGLPIVNKRLEGNHRHFESAPPAQSSKLKIHDDENSLRVLWV